MEIPRFRIPLNEKTLKQANSQNKGFAVVTLLALTPLIFAVVVAVAAALFAMKRKSLAQAICVQQVSRMQHELKKPLIKLLNMNPKATFLRTKRRAADNNLRAARASGYPPAIAAAQANQIAVILEQVEFHSRQLALLADARRIRGERERELRERASHIRGENIYAQAYYFRPLAVEPKPLLDLSPNYETVPGFLLAQQHRFTYQVDVLANFPRPMESEMPLRQRIDCAASLTERTGEWEIQILAARAL